MAHTFKNKKGKHMKYIKKRQTKKKSIKEMTNKEDQENGKKDNGRTQVNQAKVFFNRLEGWKQQQ